MAQATAGRISAGKAFVEIVADKANLIKGLKSVQRDIKAFGQSLKDLGSDMFILGGFTSVPLLKSIKMFAEFDDRIRTLKGVSGATESTMQDLKETIMDLGATTAFTANQVAEGAIELARIGFEADEVKKAIKPTLDLVRATGESVNKLGEYAGYASSVLKIFKKNAEDFNNVTNIMAYSANRSAMSIADYYESMKMAGPYAQMVGESIEGASSALMLMANMGVRGSLAGTSLRNVYQVLAATAGKLTDVTDEENNAIATNLESLETLGIRLKDTRGNLLSVAQIMDSIKNKLKEMPKNDKLNFLIEQFGLRGSLGASSMLNDYDDYFQNQEKALKNLLKAEREYKEKISKHQEAGAGGFLRGLISRWEAIQITVGEGFWETIKNASQAILGFVSGILKFIQENKKLVSSIVFATGSIFTLGITIFGVGMIIKILGAALGMVIVPLSIFTKIVLTAGKAIYFLYVGLRTLTNFTPKAISKSLTWLKKYYEKTKNIAKISFDGVVVGFRKAIIVLDSLKKALNQTYNSTSAFIKQFINLSVQVIKQFSTLSGQFISSSRSVIAIMEFLRVQAKQTTTSFWYFAEGFRLLGHNIKVYSKGVAKISYNNIRFLATNKRLASSYAMLKAGLTRFVGVMSLGSAVGATFGSVIMGAFAGLASSFIGATGIMLKFAGGFKYLKALGIQVGLTFLRIGKAIKEVALISFPLFRNGFFGLGYVFKNFYYVIASGAIAVYQFINSMLGLKVAVAGIQLLYSKFLYTTSLLIYNMVTLAFSIFSLAKAKVALMALGKGLSFVISKVWLLLKAMFSLKNLKAIWIGLTMAVKGFWLAITLSIKGVLALLTALKVGAILSFLTPFLILGGAVVTGVYVWKRYGDSMKAAFRNSKFLNNFKRDFSNAWKEIKDVGIKTFGALKEAFEVGDLVGGFKIAFASLKLILLESVQPFFNAWDKFFKQFSSGFNFLSNIFNKFSNTIDKLVYHHEYTMVSRKKYFVRGIEYTDPKTGKKRMVKNSYLDSFYNSPNEFFHSFGTGIFDKGMQKMLENGNINPKLVEYLYELFPNRSEDDKLFWKLYKKRETERSINAFEAYQGFDNQKPFTYNPGETEKTLKNAIAKAKANFSKQLDLNSSFAGNTRFLREIAEIFNNNAQKEYEMSFESVYKNNQIKRDMRRYDNMPNKTAEYELRTAILNVTSQINDIEKEFKKVQKESLTGHGDVIDANEQMRMIELIKSKGYLLTRKQELENKLSGLNQTTGQAIQEKTQNAIGAWSFAELKNSFGKSIAQKTLDANLIANNYLRKIEKNSKKDLTSLGVQYL